MDHKPILYLIASPIGNLSDISARALEILSSTPVIAAEDTRRTRHLLAAHNIRGKKVMSLHAHNEVRATAALLHKLQTLGQAAYLSDAGTPGISDPGAKLVRAARHAGVQVSPVPGASALSCILSVAGTEGSVHFFGFAPRAQEARRKFFAALPALAGSIVLFESPARVCDAIRRLREALGDDARAVLAREMTKLHEQIEDMPLLQMEQALSSGHIPQRGEFALLVESAGRAPMAEAAESLFAELARELPPRKAAKIAAKFTGESAAELYRRRIGK